MKQWKVTFVELKVNESWHFKITREEGAEFKWFLPFSDIDTYISKTADVSNSGWQHRKLIAFIYRVINLKPHPSREPYVFYLLKIKHEGLFRNILYLFCIVRNTRIRPLDHVSRYPCKSFTAIFCIKVGFQIDNPVVNTLETEILCLLLDTIGVSHFCYLVFTASKCWWHSQSTGYNSMLSSNWTKEGILLGFLKGRIWQLSL